MFSASYNITTGKYTIMTANVYKCHTHTVKHLYLIEYFTALLSTIAMFS